MGEEAGGELHATLTRLTRACDVVFGIAHTILALIATYRVAVGATPNRVAIALWAMPVVNLVFSIATRKWNRVVADGWRAIICAPLIGYCYIVDRDGMLRHLWLPAMMVASGVAMSRCTGSQRARDGIGAAILCASSIAIAAYLRDGRVDPIWIRDAMGILISGTILSVIGAQLGQALDQAPVQFVGDSLQFVSESVADLFEIVRNATAYPELAKAADEADLPYLRIEVPKALALAEDGLFRVSTIVRSMKTFAHPDSRTMRGADLNHALQATLVVATTEFKHVADLVTDFQPIPQVACFVSEINQAVLNIVVNAAHAIRDVVGASQARGTLFVGTKQVGSEVVITIRDSGAGIPELIRTRVFDPFFTTKEVGRGTGQGLSIARQIVVEKHHGKLTFETELGHGTAFQIHLPIAQS